MFQPVGFHLPLAVTGADRRGGYGSGDFARVLRKYSI
jgi:hypothetical protein